MWFVSAGGQPIGPLDDHGVIEAIRGGLRATRVTPADRAAWVPINQHPVFGSIRPSAPDQPEAVATVALAVPLLTALAFWFIPIGGIGVSFISAVLVSACLVGADAAVLGAGSPDEKGNARTGPVAWLLFAVLLWLIALPIWMFNRASYDAKGRGIEAVLVVILFMGSWVAVVAHLAGLL